MEYNFAPSGIILVDNSNTILEGQEVGTFIGKFETVDQNNLTNDQTTYDYTIDDAGAVYFSISNDSLFSKIVFESSTDPSSYTIEITSQDGNLQVTKEFTIYLQGVQ